MAAGQRLPGLIGALSGTIRFPAEGARILRHSDPTSGGALTLHQPIAIRSLSATAKRQRSFFDDWYNRVHVTPRLMNFGFVSSELYRQVSVWNAYLGPTTLGSITILSNSNVGVSGTPLPKTLKQFEALVYTVSVAADGDATIDTTVAFNITDRPDAPRLKVTGQRARLFEFRPNWANSVSVRLEYRTDISTSRSGKEQRRALRGEARKTIEFTIAVHRDRLLAFQRLMAKWQSRPVSMGDPTRQVLTTTAMDVGYMGVTVASIPKWLVAGAAVLLESGDTREVVLVDQVDGNDVTFTSGAVNTWAVGASVRPIVSGLLSTELSETYLSDELAEIAISLAVDPGSEANWLGGQVETLLMADTAIPASNSSLDGLSGGVTFSLNPGEALRIKKVAGLTYDAWAFTPYDGYPGFTGDWRADFSLRSAEGVITDYWGTSSVVYGSEDDAYVHMLAQPPVTVSGSSSYTIFPRDAATDDNREGLSVQVYKVASPGLEHVAHNDREVFPFEPDWSQSIESTLSWDRESIDFGFGRTQNYSPLDFGTVVRKAAFLNVSVEQAEAMQDFFHRAKGQRGEFYWSTGLNDLPLAAGLTFNVNTMRVAGRETFDTFNDDTVYKAVAVRLWNGQTLYRSITDMYLDAGDTMVRFTETWPANYLLSEIEKVSWLTVARFASDQFTAEWLTSDVMQTQLAIQTLENLPV